MTFLINICIALIITAVVTYLLSFRYEKKAEAAPAFEVPAGTVGSPVKGTIVAMENIPDETFAT